MNNDERDSSNDREAESSHVISPDAFTAPQERLVSSPYAQTSSTTSAPGPVVSLQPDDMPHAAQQPQDLLGHEAATNDNPVSPSTDISLDQPVRWQATEFVHHKKNITWLVIFMLFVLAFIAIAIFLIHSPSFAILIPVMAAALLVYTYREPRVLNYALSRQGLFVNDRLYSFSEFKGFGVIHGAEVGDEYSIMLIPTHRFKPGVYVYFPESSGEAIVDMLAARLPMQDLHLDVIDRVVKKLRL